ncbi:MAG: arginase family protein [Desulfovibrio sp.]|jgi:arginase family enzyme|nr:arginase family protein [Desulfovibrio sp.]
MKPPLILDFDASVLSPTDNAIRIALGGWQEAIRFGCFRSAFARLEQHLETLMPDSYGCVFTGSGDYHHISLLLLRLLARRAKLPPASLDCIVCDNHPDNMRYPFGIHCGSWVRHASELACIRHIHVIGITSADINPAHAWANYLGPLLRNKLSYWSVRQEARWLKLLGREKNSRTFASADALLAAFLPVISGAKSLYLSIDKDVFSPEVARTNWDQGIFTEDHAAAVIGACAGRLMGSDITGEFSAYAYAGMGKKLLVSLDGPDRMGACGPEEALVERETQRQLNARLLRLLEHGG